MLGWTRLRAFLAIQGLLKRVVVHDSGMLVELTGGKKLVVLVMELLHCKYDYCHIKPIFFPNLYQSKVNLLRIKAL